MNRPLLPTGEDGALTALVKIGGLKLLLPQGDVQAVEAVTDVDMGEPAPRAIGWIRRAHQRVPAYCLSGGLELLSYAPAERRACVLLASGSGYLGLLCDQFQAAERIATRRHILPRAMSLPGSPIGGVAEHDGGIACFSDGQMLAAYIVRLAAQ